MAKPYYKANKSSDSIEIPLTPDVFQVTSSGSMPIESPNTSSLTVMPELFPPTVVAEAIDWRHHPKWKPLLSTPSRLTPIPKGTLVPDPSPAHTLSDGETSTLMDPSPAGSYIHRRRQGEYVKRPPVWSLDGLAAENSPHFLKVKNPGFDTSNPGEDIPFPLKVLTDLPTGSRRVSKDDCTLSAFDIPSYSCEDQINQMATAFTTDPFIVNVAQDMTYMNLSRLDASIVRPGPGPIIEQWVRSTPPPKDEFVGVSTQDNATGSQVGASLINPSHAVLTSVSDQDQTGSAPVESEEPIESADTTLPSVEQVILSSSKGPEISPADSASAFRGDENGHRPRAHIERLTQSHRGNRYASLNHYLDIRTAPPVHGELDYAHWIVSGSRVTCVDATFMTGPSDNDDHFELKLGHQYIVSKIFADQWALCVRCDIQETLKLHHDRIWGKSIGKKIMHTLRSKPKKPINLPHTEMVEYDRKIINFLPLCAVTLEANYGAYLELSGSRHSTTNSSSSRTRVRESERSPAEGGIVPAPERTSSHEEAVKIWEAGFVEVPEHIYVAGQMGPHKGSHVTVHALENGSREDLIPAQHSDGRGTVKKSFMSLGRFIGRKSVRRQDSLKDAARRLQKGQSFGNLLERPRSATHVQPAIQASQPEDTTASTAGDLASDALSNEVSSQAPEGSIPRVTNTAKVGSHESREPLLPSTYDAIAAMSASNDGFYETAPLPTGAASSIPSDAALQTPPDAATTSPASEHRALHRPDPAAVTTLGAATHAPSNTPPPIENTTQENIVSSPRPSPKAAHPSPPPAHDRAPTAPPNSAPAAAATPAPSPRHIESPTYGALTIPNVSHVEFIGSPDSIWDPSWERVSGLADPPIPLPR